MENGESRIDQYKRKGSHWRDTLKDKCFQRLRARREQLHASRRVTPLGEGQMEVAHDVLDEVWTSFAAERKSSPEDSEEVEHMQKIYEEIKQELMRKEAEMIAEFEAYQRQEQLSTDACIDAALSDGVVCPICCKQHLMQNLHIIFCRCGFRIDTQFDGLTLEQLGIRLHFLADRHSSTCSQPPVFEMQSIPMVMTNSTALVMTCKFCGVLEVVI
eukprot:m.23448 g.23448  ORF g.23448 m.23448 type:complete len:215 (-) comp7500_c0_seq3:96-740(-)